jgi:predicted outer membrane repeat protein
MMYFCSGVDTAPGATLGIRNLTVTHGMSDQGGAILNDGHLDIVDSTFTLNTAFNTGGAIFQEGDSSADIRRSTFSQNKFIDVGSAGAIYNDGSGPLVIRDSSFLNNLCGGSGAGGALLV